MGFRLKNEARTDIDFGETSIENIFIKHFLPFANEEQIKVYILGMYYAKSNRDADLKTLAAELDIPESRVMSALEYWEKNDLLTIEKKEEGFGVAYFSVRSQVFAGNKNVQTLGAKSKALAEMLTSVTGKTIGSSEYAFYEKFVSDLGGDIEILRNVLILYYKDFKGNDFSEISKFLENIAKSGSRDIEHIIISANNHFSRHLLYKRVKTLIGGKAIATPAEQTMINEWMDRCGMTESEIIKFVEQNSPNSNNPSVGFINKLIKDIKGIPSEEADKLALFKRLKLEITGSRYAINKKEYSIMDAWFTELGLDENQILSEIATHSAHMRGATVGRMDEKIRGIELPSAHRNSVSSPDADADTPHTDPANASSRSANPSKEIPAPKGRLKIKNKKDKIEEFVDEELMEIIRKRENSHGSK